MKSFMIACTLTLLMLSGWTVEGNCDRGEINSTGTERVDENDFARARPGGFGFVELLDT